MNTPDKQEVKQKKTRVHAYLTNHGYDAMIIGRQDNFAWFTDGGENRVINLSESGAALLVITKDKTYLVAMVMDGRRIMDEELNGLDIEYVPLRWYESGLDEKALELVKGSKVVADVPIAGADCRPGAFYQLHYPLTAREIQKLHWLGKKVEETVTKVAHEIQPGMSEYDVEAMLLNEYTRENIHCPVGLIGSDERIFKYRHPLPSTKKIEKYVLLAAVPRKWGLNVPLSRLVYFGDHIPKEIVNKYDAVCQIAAAATSMCVPGTKFSDILAEQKKLYKELGYEDEWRNHFQGGVTGYQIVNATLCDDPSNVVQENEAYAWFITIAGVKSEELSINAGKPPEILTVTGKWPTKAYQYNGKTFNLPVILKR